MSRLFSTSVRTLLNWSGFDRSNLPEKWRSAVENFTKSGGRAETVCQRFCLVAIGTSWWQLDNCCAMNQLADKEMQKLGKLKSVNIKHRDDNPIHKSHFNREDKEWVISAEISGENGRKVCHIYEDGTGTTKKGEERR